VPGKDELPSTLRRSPRKARETWAKTHDSAVQTYGEGERAHRTAFAALKHAFEKVGDHWEPKKSKGPSDRQAAGGSRTRRPTAEGVDANASKSHLMDLARRLRVPGRSNMDKQELVEGVKKANRRETAKAREKPRSKR
jgi:cation transport regulator ChaB